MKVVTFYTPEYADEVAPWAAAIEHFGLEPWAKPIPNQGSWRLNCGYKALFMLECLQELREPCLWLDVDGRFEAQWDLDGTLNKHFDFAIWFIPNKAMRKQDIPGGPGSGHCGLASGTMWLNYTPMAEHFLKLWLLAEQGQGKFEQKVLGEVWYQDRPEKLRTHKFHQKYCKVDNAKWFEDEPDQVVIGHYQASRRLCRVANDNGVRVLKRQAARASARAESTAG